MSAWFDEQHIVITKHTFLSGAANIMTPTFGKVPAVTEMEALWYRTNFERLYLHQQYPKA